VTVPGAAAGWADTVQTFGTLPLATLLQPAIDLAEHGFPVHAVTAHSWAAGAHLLQSPVRALASLWRGRQSRTHTQLIYTDIFRCTMHERLDLVHLCPLHTMLSTPQTNPGGAALLRSGRAPRAGEIMRNSDLAATFRALARDGRDGFYKVRALWWVR
jgi:gamma-glutamyltranspeptidase / glutathione hydrolase